MSQIRRNTAWILATVMVACACMDLGVAAPMGVATWSGGGGNGSWSTASNWSTLPTTSGSWSLVFGGTTQTTNTNNIGTITLGTMSFTNDGSVGKTTAFTLSGSTLAISDGTIMTSATAAGGAITDTIGNALTLTGSNTASLGSAHNLTVSGNITGAGSLTKTGDGGLYLTGSNSQSGSTYITAGNVRTGAGGGSTGSNNYAFGTGDVVVSGSGTLTVRNNSTVANNLSLGGIGWAVSNASLFGSFASSSATAVVSGSIALSSDTAISTWGSAGVTGSKLSLTGPINLGSRRLTFTQTVTDTTARTWIEVGGAIAGTGSVLVDGNANVYLDGANSYSGGTTIQTGTVHAGNATALGTGSATLNAGVLDLNGRSLSIGALSGSSGALITSMVSGSASLTSNTAAQTTYAGRITDGAGVVSLTKDGTGSLFLTGSNSQTGTTYITGGNLRTGSGGSSTDSNNYALGTGDVVVSGSGTLTVRNNSTVANNMTIGGVGFTASNSSLFGSFAASGATAVVSGSVAVSGNTRISTWGSDGVTGSKLSLTGPIHLGANTLTFGQVLTGTNGARTTAPATWIEVGGAIAGTGSVIIDGTATVYLNGANTYTGSTTVQSGVLGGDGTIAGAVTVQNGAFLTPGSAANTIGALGVGSLQLDAGATTAMSIAGTDVSLYDQVVALGNVNFGGALDIDFETAGFVKFDFWQLFSGATSSGHFSSISATGAYGDLTFQHVGGGEWQATGGSLGAGEMLLFFEQNSNPYVSAGRLVLVPEPSTIVFAGIGLLVLGWRRFSRRRSPPPSLDAVAA